MTDSEYRHALRLLDATLTTLAPRRERPAAMRRRLHALSLKFALLRAGLRQPAVMLQRN